MIYLASASPRRHELLCQAALAHTVLHVPSPPGEDEPRLPGESPDAYVQRTAREKALRALHWLGVDVEGAQAGWPRSAQPPALYPVLAADTTVILGGEILGKPNDADDAALMLRRLSGTLHEVHTAIVLALPGHRGAPRAAMAAGRSKPAPAGPGPDPQHPGTAGTEPICSTDASSRAGANSLVCDVSRTHVKFKTLTDEEIAAYCASKEPMGKAGAYGIQGRAAAFVEHISGSYSGVVGLPLYETARLLKQSGLDA